MSLNGSAWPSSTLHSPAAAGYSNLLVCSSEACLTLMQISDKILGYMHLVDRLHVAGMTSSTSKAAAAKSGQPPRTEPWSKIYSIEAKQASKRHCSESTSGVSAEPSEAGPSDPGSAGLEMQAAEHSPGNGGASAHYMSPDGKIRKAAEVQPKHARKNEPSRTKQRRTKSTSSKRPAIAKAIGIVRPETDQGKSRCTQQTRCVRNA